MVRVWLHASSWFTPGERLDRRLGRPERQSECCGIEITLLSLLGIESHSSSPQSYRLSHPSSRYDQNSSSNEFFFGKQSKRKEDFEVCCPRWLLDSPVLLCHEKNCWWKIYYFLVCLYFWFVQFLVRGLFVPVLFCLEDKINVYPKKQWEKIKPEQ